MQDTLISFETAKLAKEKEFKISCDHYYDADKMYNTPQAFDGNVIDDGYYHDDYYLRPNQSLLQKWLREEYNYHVYVYPVALENYKVCHHLGGGYTFCKSEFLTYEEALEHGLMVGLKTI